MLLAVRCSQRAVTPLGAKNRHCEVHTRTVLFLEAVVTSRTQGTRCLSGSVGVEAICAGERGRRPSGTVVPCRADEIDRRVGLLTARTKVTRGALLIGSCEPCGCARPTWRTVVTSAVVIRANGIGIRAGCTWGRTWRSLRTVVTLWAEVSSHTILRISYLSASAAVITWETGVRG